MPHTKATARRSGPQDTASHPHKFAPGELMVLGFHGPQLPSWVEDFAACYGLGGIILFDYDCQSKTYDNNIQSPAQLKDLCAQIHALPCKPLVMIDQEGGKVRRLKEKLGFRPLPSALQFNALPTSEKERLVEDSFSEMRQLGIDFDLMPVVDLNINPASPGLGAAERCYSALADEIRDNVEVLNGAAHRTGLGLCLKHYPGLGGAVVDSHADFTDISASVNDEQLELFYELSQGLFGNAVLVSHGMVKQWDNKYPVSVSAAGIKRLRDRCPDSLLLTDDMQMQGLLKLLGLKEACVQGVSAGIDMVLIGNNLIRTTPAELADIAEALQKAADSDSSLYAHCQSAMRRIKLRKADLVK